VLQDRVSEEWWNIVQTSSIIKEVNVTKVTAHVTSWPGTTTTSFETNVHLTNKSVPVTFNLGGYNPISLFPNKALATPTQIIHSHSGTALVTGGITMYVEPEIIVDTHILIHDTDNPRPLSTFTQPLR
jgi:hypothetical protein